MTGKYLLLAVLATAAFAQDPVSITPYQLIDARAGNAIACSNCSIYTYAAGTNTPLATYTSSTLATPNTNPVLTNSAGYAVNGATITGIWVGSSCYKFVAKDSSAVTLFTQDNICNRGAVLKALLAASSGSSLIGYTLGVTGAQTTTVQNRLRQRYELKADFGAVGNQTTNDTAAMLAATLAAQNNGFALHAPGGTYGVTSVVSTVAGPFSLICDGPKQTTFIRHSTALQASTPLLKLTNATHVGLKDCGWNELGDGTNFTNAAATVFMDDVGSVDIDNNYSTLAQSGAFLIDGASGGVKFTNNTCSYFWWFCMDVAGNGTVSAKVYTEGVVLSNNICYHGPYCSLVTKFVKGSTQTGNVGINSSFSVVQDTPNAIISNNVVIGAPDYGLGIATGTKYDCIFAEPAEDMVISGNYVSGCSKHGIFSLGSELPVGTTEQLPTKRVNISGNYIDNVDNQAAIYVRGASTSGTLGEKIIIKGNTITNSLVGIILTSADGVDVSDNYEDNLQNGGDQFGAITNFRISGNKYHNTNTGTPGTQPAISINTSLNGVVQGNIVTGSGGNTNSVCFADTTLAGGTVNTSGTAVTWVTGVTFDSSFAGLQMSIAGTVYLISSVANSTNLTLTTSAGVQAGAAFSITTQIQILGDNIFTSCGAAVSPAVTAPPTLGTWPAGARTASFTTTTGAVTEWFALGGTPGIWQPLGFLGNGGLPVTSSCGTGSPAVIAGSNNNFGVTSVGGGAVTSCTITFSNAFSGAPSCVLTGTGSTAFPYISSISTTTLVVGFSANYGNQFLHWRCQ